MQNLRYGLTKALLASIDLNEASMDSTYFFFLL